MVAASPFLPRRRRPGCGTKCATVVTVDQGRVSGCSFSNLLLLFFVFFFFVVLAGNPSREGDEQQGSERQQQLARRGPSSSSSSSSSFCCSASAAAARGGTGRAGGGQFLPPPRRRVLRHQPGPARRAGEGDLAVARRYAWFFVKRRRIRRQEQLEQAPGEVSGGRSLFLGVCRVQHGQGALVRCKKNHFWKSGRGG